MATSKSIYLLALLAMFTLLSYSQQYNYALYDISATIDTKPQQKNLKSTQNRILQQMIRSANLKKLELIFNTKTSLFRPANSLDSDYRANKLSKGFLVFLGIENELYIDAISKKIYKKRGNDSYEHYVKYDMQDINWKITDNKKTVKKMTYRKATTRLKIMEKEFDIIAWFCPQISVKLGPSYFYDLPGLITEVYVSSLESSLKYSLILSKMKYDPNYKDISLPLKGYDIYSEEQSQKVFSNQLNSNFNRN